MGQKNNFDNNNAQPQSHPGLQWQQTLSSGSTMISDVPCYYRKEDAEKLTLIYRFSQA